jgi:hypothetical protein
LELLGSYPQAVSAASTSSATEVLLAALDGSAGRRSPLDIWPGLDASDLLVTPLSTGDERLGLLCLGARPGSAFSVEDTEIARAIAHLAAIAIKRADLIDRLTNANTVKDLFRGLAAGAGEFAAAKAAEVRCDLTAPYLIACAEPAADGGAAGSGQWRDAADKLGRALGDMTVHSAVAVGPGPVHALLVLGVRGPELSPVLVQRCRELGERYGAVIGLSELRDAPGAATRAYREAQDSVTIGAALLAGGGAIAYSDAGAYRYLVHIAAEDAPNDPMRTAVEILADYDHRRKTALLHTLERYLAQRRSVLETARALFIHPNTLRQRLGRIQELTGLDLNQDDLLSLELAAKLARLHGLSGNAP